MVTGLIVNSAKTNRPNGIILLGANGSGKSTLGQELAQVLNFAHFDAEAYYWYKTALPYTSARSYTERQDLLLSDIKKYGSFVMSGDISGWGEVFPPHFVLAVFIDCPTHIRISRIEKRELDRHGKRILAGGDMYEQHKGFVRFAASRDIYKLKQTAENYPCPLLYIDGTVDYRKNAADIAEYYKTKR
jgi:adenylate kinase family enzyme